MKNEENIHKNHRLRMKEKVLSGNFDSFADHEKLEVLLYYAIPQGNVNPLCHKLIKKFGSFSGVFDATYEQLLEIDGVGPHTAMLITLLPKLFNAYSRQRAQNFESLSTSYKTIQYARMLLAGAVQEEFYVICVNAQNKILGSYKLASGSFHKVEVSLRDITEIAIKNKCDRIIIAHNHPTATSKPSDQDLLLTFRIVMSCLLNDIKVLDHVIISPTDGFSFAHNELMYTFTTEIFKNLHVNLQNPQYKKFLLEQSADTYEES